jgi:transcriptional regulator with XRE-family HTH domain
VPRFAISFVTVDEHNALGDFLRARRNATMPREVGLPNVASRRVPGLRREEVALLAGVSTDYYVRLEQGRERFPSPQVLQAIARVLRLDDPAAAHLFRLGHCAPQTTAVPDGPVSAEVLRMMNSLGDVPAFVVGRAQDILAANAMAEALYAGFARFDNLLRMIFLDPFARDFYADWDRAASIATGNLRASSARFPDDERIEQLVGALSVRSEAFAASWVRYDVRPRTRELKEFRHPQVGTLRLTFEALDVLSSPGQHLSVYGAEAGGPSADALVLLRQLAEQRPEHDDEPRIDESAWEGL